MSARSLIPLMLALLPMAGLLTATASQDPGSKQPVAASSRARAAAAPSRSSSGVHAPAKPAVLASAKPVDDSFKQEALPLLRKYCVGCHGGGRPSAGLSFADFRDTAAVLKSRSVWEKVARNVGISRMPPAGAAQPTAQERGRLVSWVEATLSKADCRISSPGRVTMRRLNREEYNNTIRDLFGLTMRPADDFPSDDVGYGFDNIGDVLSLSPLLMEKYINAAEKVSQAAIIAPETSSQAVRYGSERLSQGKGDEFDPGGVLNSAGETGVTHEFPSDGDYVLRARAYGQQAGPEPAKMALRLDGKDLTTVDVAAVEADPAVYQVKTHVARGQHRFTAAFLNDYHDAKAPTPNDRNLIVDSLEVQGPLEWQGPYPVSHARIMISRPTPQTRDEAARKILTVFARRAYRRPVTKEEVDRLVRYVHLAQEQGESFERGIQLGVQAALCSPNFLFRVEVDPKDGQPRHPVSQYEMASRLSYFLWSSMPDEELFSLAAKGKLQDPKVLEAQVKRMLQDSRAQALADNFAAQWLTLRRLANVSPARRMFPEFSSSMRQAMRTETVMFFEEIVKRDRSILDFLDGRFTYVNEPLAKLYGIPGVTGDKFQRVALADNTHRRGIITQASILTVTSNPTRTSPVKRGKWVLEQLLNAAPPPPPANVAKLPDDQGRRGPLTGTLRQRMEQHRKNPMCASCHTTMDQIGFGLENFDAIGRWRNTDGGSLIDSSGVLPGGKKFDGPIQLVGILKAKQDQFAKCLTEKMLTYALGRGLEPYDNCNVNGIVQRIAKKDYRFSALVTEVALSEPFRVRQGDGGRN
jgi:mono/diheme cytochrome c family protein